MVSDTGAPSLQPIYLELRKFLAAATTLEFDFCAKKVFTAMVWKFNPRKGGGGSNCRQAVGNERHLCDKVSSVLKFSLFECS
jgi:hypothetical protein